MSDFSAPQQASRRWLQPLALGVCVLCGAGAGVLFFAPVAAPSMPAALVQMPAVTLDGEPFALGADAAASFALAQAHAQARLSARVRVDFGANLAAGQPQVLERTRDEFGLRVDAARLRAVFEQVHDASSVMRKRACSVLALRLPSYVDSKISVSALATLKDALESAPVDARYSLAQRKITPDEPGRRLDVTASLRALEAALTAAHAQPAEVNVVYERVAARRSAAALGEITVADALGYFETKFTKDWSHEARSYNLKLAASKLDGTVILPGETFDFNETVGPRTEAFGYKIATVISQGELVDGIGGGTCQIAGTLHGAAFFAGLEIVDRRPHSRPSGYIKMGLDATVVYPSITLRIRNPFSFPVVLHETVEDGVVHAEVLGPPRSREITLIRKVNSAFPFPVKEVKDAKLKRGEHVLAQRGIPGFKVTRYRIVRDGSFAVREKYLDLYPPTPELWKNGTSDDEDAPEGHDDGHREYVVDEFLTMSQGPDIRVNYAARGGGSTELKLPGKFGNYGWTYREGFTRRRD